MGAGPATTRSPPGGFFVGRGWELGQLQEGLSEAKAGRGRLYAVTGEAGIGKTRLARRLADLAEQDGLGVAWGRCWEAEASPPFWPWVQVFRSLALMPQWAGATGGKGPAGARLLPELRSLVTDDAEGLPHRPTDQARFRLFDGAATVIGTMAAGRPLVVVLDDLHGADRSSLLLLDFLARTLGEMAVLVVATFREPEGELNPTVNDLLAGLGRHGYRLRLGGLRRAEIADFLAEGFAVVAEEGELSIIEESTGGNPFFLDNVARRLATGGHLEKPADGGFQVPEDIREAIRRRLTLPEESRRILALAAVMGREFSFGLLATASGLPRAQLLDTLAELAQWRLVDPAGFGLGPYRFIHALVRETVYQDLPAAERPRMHRCVGEAIEAMYAADLEPHLDHLAHHFAQAAALGDAGRAIEYARRAAERAARTLGHEEAAEHYRRALELASEHAVGAGDRFELLVGLGDAEWWAGRVSEASTSFQEAAVLARQMGDASRLAEAALRFGEVGYGGVYTEAWLFDPQKVGLLEEALEGLAGEPSPLAARVAGRLAAALYFSPFDSTARRDALSRRAVEQARNLGDPTTLAYTLWARHLAVWSPDNVEERLRLATEIGQLAVSGGDAMLELTGHVWRLADLLERGDPEGAYAEVDEYAALAERVGHPQFRAYALMFQAMRAQLRGDFAEAEALGKRSLTIGERVQDPNIALSHHIQMASTAAWQGRPHQCAEHLQAITQDMPAEVAALVRTYFLRLSGDPSEVTVDFSKLLRVLDRWTPALRLLGLSEMALLAAEAGAPGAAAIYDALLPYEGRFVLGGRDAVACAGPVSLWLGLLATSLARFEEAGRHFDAAIAASSLAGARPFLAAARLGLAGMLARRGRDEDGSRAEALATDAFRIADEIGLGRNSLEIISLSQVLPSPPPRVVEAAPALAAVFRAEGDYWTVAFEGTSVRIKDAKGLRYLRVLLGAAGREFHALDLAAGGGTRVGTALRGSVDAATPFGLDAGPALDPAAKAAYRSRLEELRSDLSEAEDNADLERASRLREEIDFLVGELTGALGLGGRDRAAASPGERARSAVGKSLRASVKHIGEVHPALGSHLAATVRTGYFCSYKPDPRAPVEWET